MPYEKASAAYREVEAVWRSLYDNVDGNVFTRRPGAKPMETDVEVAIEKINRAVEAFSAAEKRR